MARLAKQKVHAALEKAAQNILDAAGDDPVVSRKDIRKKLKELEGTEQQLTSNQTIFALQYPKLQIYTKFENKNEVNEHICQIKFNIS